MRWRRPANTRNGLTNLGISLLILGLVHTPLPQPDFHNIRHQDGPGEVCAYHHHLLRWHPEAVGAADVAVLHWHWFLPGESPTPEGSGPAVHAHLPAWQATAWDDAPRLVAPDSTSRSVARPAPSPLDLVRTVPDPSRFGIFSSAGGMRPFPAFGATFAPGVSRNALLHRWDC